MSLFIPFPPEQRTTEEAEKLRPMQACFVVRFRSLYLPLIHVVFVVVVGQGKFLVSGVCRNAFQQAYYLTRMSVYYFGSE